MATIEQKLQSIMAWYCPYPAEDIDMSQNFEDLYVPNNMGHNFADNICGTWTEIDCTRVHNEMFVGLKKGSDVATAIKSIGYDDDEESIRLVA